MIEDEDIVSASRENLEKFIRELVWSNEPY